MPRSCLTRDHQEPRFYARVQTYNALPVPEDHALVSSHTVPQPLPKSWSPPEQQANIQFAARAHRGKSLRVHSSALSATLVRRHLGKGAVTMVQSRLKPAQRVFRPQLLEFAAGPRFSMAGL
ncbi:hypothetical protein HZ326_0816 [Fusarium oxysporum f. sp. albedinis]|nr:hypothetical protein HZ326_0816 [Fusarium oxysporum f. sp. albedinis]